jgi:hypothetical protein
MKLISPYNVKTYCLTVPWATERIAKIKKQFDSINKTIEFIYGQKTTPYAAGLAQSHIEALEKSGKEPCLILEDDALFSSNASNYDIMSYSLPDYADALYLGTSVFGRIKGVTVYRGLLASDYSASLMRVFNKLSMHAVLHISDEYKASCIEAFKGYISNPVGGCDDPIADRMKMFNVFSVKDAMFVQSDGHNDGATIEKPQMVL